MDPRPKPVDMSGILTGSSSLSARLSLWNARTGRTMTPGPEISEWANAGSHNALLAHVTCAKFKEEIARIPHVTAMSLMCFRGRNPPFDGQIPTLKEMGPPDDDQANTGGRYNRAGESVFYLCDSEDGVRRELAGRQGPMWVQKYRINPSDYRIADIRANQTNAEDFVNCVLFFAELAGVDGYPGFEFSQTIAELVGTRFDGMMVPGVRGDNQCNYHNVVMFRAHAIWRTWLTGTSPYQLRTATSTTQLLSRK